MARRWGCKVWHVFESGCGTDPWFGLRWQYRVRFVVRWKEGKTLLDAAGQERKHGLGDRQRQVLLGPGGQPYRSQVPTCEPCRCVIPRMRATSGWSSCNKGTGATPGLC
jgi:hypothetical protein